MANNTPPQLRIMVEIVEVEPDTQTAHCADKSGARIKISFGDNFGILVVPKVGELWNAQRSGYTWKLLSRVSSTLGLNQGDALIDLAGLLILANVPTADPHVKNAVWSNAGTLKLSAG